MPDVETPVLPVRVDRPQNETSSDVAELQTALGSAEDQLKRALADLDNYRKRFDRELVRLVERRADEILRDLLPVADNLERALSMSPESGTGWQAGVDAVNRQLQAVLKRHGVEPIEDKGKHFDPAWHDVIGTVESPAEDGTIVEVAETGYRIGDRPLRHARVLVAGHEK